MTEETTDQRSFGGEEADRQTSQNSPAVESDPAADAEAGKEELLRIFVGPNANNFIKIRQAQLEKKNVMSFNWAAFVAVLPWLFYRKLYFLGACVTLVPIALVVIFPGLADVSLASGVMVFAFMGNVWYIDIARRRIEKLELLDLPPTELKERVRLAGGTSPAGAVFGTLIVISLIALPFINKATTGLPECGSLKVQALANGVITDSLSRRGVITIGVTLSDFQLITSGDNASQHKCSFVANHGYGDQTMYLSVAWHDEDAGEFIVTVNKSLDAL